MGYKDCWRRAVPSPLKNIDLQNDFNIVVAKQWKFRTSVPMEPKWDLKGALNGTFKGTFKGKFERQSSLVNLRGGIRC